jgi:hypothetical protein
MAATVAERRKWERRGRHTTGVASMGAGLTVGNTLYVIFSGPSPASLPLGVAAALLLVGALAGRLYCSHRAAGVPQ